MNKYLINTIAIGNYENIPYGKHTIPTFINYSKKYNADFLILDKNYVGLPPTFNKFLLFEHFIQTNYEKMLYLDLDVKILKNSPNIFEMFDEVCMVIDRENRIFDAYDESMTEFDLPLLTSIKKWTKNTYNEEYSSNTAFNAGVIGISKEAAIKLVNTFKNNIKNGLISYINEYKPNTIFNRNSDYDQSYLNYFLTKTDIKIKILDSRYNATARWKDENLIPETMKKWKNGNSPVKSDTHHFIHYKSAKHLIGTDWDIFN